MALPVAAATGVLNDVDHTLDYYLWYVKKDKRRAFLLFHGWEYSIAGLILAAAVWAHPVFLAATLGHLGHLIGDQIGNRPEHPLAYSLVYRTSRRFQRNKLFGESRQRNLSEALEQSIPLWHLIEPRLLSIAPGLRSFGFEERES